MKKSLFVFLILLLILGLIYKYPWRRTVLTKDVPGGRVELVALSNYIVGGTTLQVRFYNRDNVELERRSVLQIDTFGDLDNYEEKSISSDPSGDVVIALGNLKKSYDLNNSWLEK